MGMRPPPPMACAYQTLPNVSAMYYIHTVYLCIYTVQVEWAYIYCYQHTFTGTDTCELVGEQAFR